MLGFMLLKFCNVYDTGLPQPFLLSLVERLAGEIEESVLGLIPKVRAASRTPPMCAYQNDRIISCVWNASYTFKDCMHLRRATLDAKTITTPDKYGDMEFCDVDLGCRGYA